MSEIYNIIEKKKLDVVSNSIEKSHGLPNECYTSEKYTQLERKKLFEDKWVVIGIASSLPNKGDAKPFDLLGIPIIILRDKKSKIRVFHNVCSHRGYKILKESCKIKNFIRCPYHSWSYDLDGELVATPHLGGMNKHETKDFDKLYATAEAKTKPRDSIAATFSNFMSFAILHIWSMDSLKPFSSFIRVVISLNKIPFLG